jgi:hypothetical protein
MPQALARALQKGPGGGSAVGGFCHVAPPSVLRQMPPSFVALVSATAVTSTFWALSGSTRRSARRKGGSVSTCDQVAPPSLLRQRPPLSLAARAMAGLLGSTATATVRPPQAIFGWKGATALAAAAARVAGAAAGASGTGISALKGSPMGTKNVTVAFTVVLPPPSCSATSVYSPG